MNQFRRSILETIYLDLKCFFENDTMSGDVGVISWSHNSIALFHDWAKNNKDLIKLAKIYELFGIIDRNTYQLCKENNYITNYIYTNFINFGCFYYYACGFKDYAASLAKSNYFNQINEYEPSMNRNIEKAVYLETLGDTCIFFDKNRSINYYNQAQGLFLPMDITEQRGETCDSYWNFVGDHYGWTINNCFSKNISFEDSGYERIEQKKTLFLALIK